MERQIEGGCGLDVHRDTVAACVRVPGAMGDREQHVRTFRTTAAELLALLRGSFVPPVPIRELRPGNNESAGKHKSGKTRKGNRWLRMASRGRGRPRDAAQRLPSPGGGHDVPRPRAGLLRPPSCPPGDAPRDRSLGTPGLPGLGTRGLTVSPQSPV